MEAQAAITIMGAAATILAPIGAIVGAILLNKREQRKNAMDGQLADRKATAEERRDINSLAVKMIDTMQTSVSANLEYVTKQYQSAMTAHAECERGRLELERRFLRVVAWLSKRGMDLSELEIEKPLIGVSSPPVVAVAQPGEVK